MSLTDLEIRELAKRMNVPLADVCFKDEIEAPLEFNQCYILNMDDAVDQNGDLSPGTHWVFLQINKTPKGQIEPIYFDSYGVGPPEHVKKVVKETTKLQGLPHTNKDIQSLMNNACGYYCLALGHFLNASTYRSNNLYNDVDTFMDMFDDLNKSVDFKKNEYILKHFFRSSDPNKRKPIDVDDIVNEDHGGGIDAFKDTVNVKVLNQNT